MLATKHICSHIMNISLYRYMVIAFYPNVSKFMPVSRDFTIASDCVNNSFKFIHVRFFIVLC